jgi:uncharacterized protein (TIGR01777 family)
MPSSHPILVISGASGLIGSHLSAAAKDRYELRLLTRNVDKSARSGASWVAWNPEAAAQGDETALNRLAETLSGAHAIVNLAGASVANGRLGEAHQKRLVKSRVQSAKALLLAQRRAQNPAKVWFQPSGINFYGDRGDAALTERAAPGSSPLSDICRIWEAAPEDAGGARLIVGRISVVLAKDAPTWKKLLLPVKLFAGGPFGSGEQWFSWIDADDLAHAILFLIENEASEGVYNLTAPEPLRQVDFVRRVASRLSRPAALPAPAFALRLALGGLADALLLASARVLPERLQQEGFTYGYPTFEVELNKLL